MSQLKTLIPRTTSFYGESLSDLELMPTTTKLGEGEYPRILASEGAIAQILTEGKLIVYMLRSSGWVELTMPGGGGTGTNDYNQLINKPTINGKTVVGNVTSNDIDVASKAIVNGENLILG